MMQVLAQWTREQTSNKLTYESQGFRRCLILKSVEHLQLKYEYLYCTEIKITQNMYNQIIITEISMFIIIKK